MKRLLAAVAAALLVGSVATPASATYPGSNGDILYVRGFGEVNALYLMDPSGEPDGLFYEDRGGASIVSPSWSADGQRLAFVRTPGEIWVMRADGTHAKFRTTGARPSLSPDGTAIAFQRSDEIWVQFPGSSAVQLTDTVGNDEPEWSPDGSRILYRDNFNAVWVMDPDGSNKVCVLCTGDDATNPTWSPSGKKIAFHYNDEVYIYRLGDPAPRQLTTTPRISEMECSWSPDGRWLVCSADGRHGPGLETIRVRDGMRRFLPTPTSAREPAWRPIPVTD